MSVEDNDNTLPATLAVDRGDGDSADTVTDVVTEGEVQVGDVISERYELVKLLGEGGMGRVFLATDQLYAREFEDRQSQVAIKFLGVRFSTLGVARMALQREARKSQQLSHPNVVRVLHFDQHRGLPYMIMEVMRGQPLDDFLREHCRDGLPLDRALPLIEGMASGLDYVHAQGLIHSDFKPNNVFVGEDGSAKILDLGIARAREDAFEDLENTRFNAGDLGAMTPAYASVEMFQGLAPDPSDDVYALACVSYELLTGEHPFRRQPAVRARSEGMKPARPKGLSRDRWRALQQGLAFARHERTATAGKFAAGLSGQRARRERLLAALALVVALTGVLAWVGGQSFRSSDPDARFLASLTPAQVAPLSARDSQRVSAWLEQGEAYLGIARGLYAAGEVTDALHVMDGGADNAFGAFANVLKLTPSEPARQGVRQMLSTYLDWARQSAAAGDLESAVVVTCHGLSVNPENARLLELQARYSADLPPERVAALKEC